MAEAFLQVVLENLDSLIQNEIGLIWGIGKEMEKLSSTISTIQAVLEDAEEKQVRDRAIKNWLRKLKDAAYELDDILDECSTEASRLTFKVNPSCFCPNNILFRHKIGKKIVKIRERLDGIAQERTKFHLIDVVHRRVELNSEKRQTGSIVTQAHVYGRDEDKEEVINYLVCSAPNFDDVTVYPIVGIGGLGKTTLAQLVFNDERVKKHFEQRIWVCVSEDFDVRRLVKAIIESASGNACPELDLDPMQKRLREILSGKRYLLVLDDVWNEDQEKWDRLKYVLACGSKGASIIVTTRLKKVASVMGTLPVHNLSCLSEDDCWSLFSERAFGHKKEESSRIIAIGKEIVRKCGGVPLAAKTLGSLMCYKRGENEWLSVKGSEIWNLPQDESSILPALRLSYSNLPLNLRKCFAYCAIFPKDIVMEKENLIHLWMANGFISSVQKMELEDIGNEICNELCWRSFFQDVETDELGRIKRFKMHDLIHDLAQSVMEDECCVEETERFVVNSTRIRHVTLLTYRRQQFTIPEALYEVETLRTFLLLPILSTSISRRTMTMPGFSCDFSRLCTLRVFGARKSHLMSLEYSIHHLKHLRYLDLSYTFIRNLPRSICSLLNLQTLKLEGCVALQKLPKQIRNLKNLRHLFLNSCFSLSHMPPKIGEITCLKTLTLFIVGKSLDSCLAELLGLNLRGDLHITHLERVINPMDAKAANLVRKHELRNLSFSWGCDTKFEQQQNVEKVLEALEPHPNLEYLTIEGYRGTSFPCWMRDQTLNNVVSISLKKCKHCLRLPALGQLPSLQYLELYGMDNVLYLDHNIYGGGMARGFPLLKHLEITNFPSLERLSMEEGKELLPRLTWLSITNCPKLTLPCLSSLECLTVHSCNEELLISISNLKSLNILSIGANNDIICLPCGMLQNLTSLRSLRLERFTKLKGLPADITNLSSLKYLYVEKCHEFESFPEQGLQGLVSLEHLLVRDCCKFNSLSEGLQHLTALEELILEGCPDLVALPNGIKHLKSLQHLTISGQPTAIDGSADPTGCKFPRLTVMSHSFREPIENIGCPKLKVLPETLCYIPALQSLSIFCYPDLVSLPDWLGDIKSLKSLQIFNCPNLKSFPLSIQRLTNLQNLDIQQCPALSKQCKKETGRDWQKIMHVPNVYIYPLAATN